MNRRLPPAIVQERVTVQVKWFNPTKGFGFVVPEDDDNSDAFLHASVLPLEDAAMIAEGVTLVCDLAQGQKGLMVSTVYSVDASTAAPQPSRGPSPGPRPGGFGGGMDRGPRHHQSSGPPGEPGEGTVKFFNDAKGFGFVTPDNGGQDVFVSARILGRAGLQTLETAQRVRYVARQGDKGPMAEKIEPL
ncbi:MAG: cold-shock protein [Alphaproteobacteria bacterium]|jgi:CspA family cold shock protein|uniref:cold-shock protein n=1 Tax=Pacificispira sp. TaxID=2888761 RepID=UPI001B17228F|nr:CspA family cold shock protein [Alphaproteobacteria bacterium]MBO6863058.1 CspA family cold shock protein [Alphaproteobacteria bacterium]MEC9266361.1 cold-shock protein [Pseudomonadota bacterium]